MCKHEYTITNYSNEIVCANCLIPIKDVVLNTENASLIYVDPNVDKSSYNYAIKSDVSE